MKQKILLVDDDPDILEFLGYNIRKEGYNLETAENGREALLKMEEFMPDLVILDVMMPVMNGIETCETIRKHSKFDNCIIAFLTARSEDYSQIAGFDSGGDDYITKPIRPKVLMSKIKSLLRRKHIKNNDLPDETIENFFIDNDRFLIIKENKEFALPKKEFEIISLLSSKPNYVFSREKIFKEIWGDNIIVGDRTIDVHIRKIRQKIGDNIIKTVKGVGYKFDLG